MSSISAKQVKGARGMLDWTQEELATHAKVSPTTVSNFEKGFPPKPKTVRGIRKAIENAGIEFIHQGLRYRLNGFAAYDDADSCDTLFDDIAETVKRQGGDVFAVIKSLDVLTWFSGTPRRNNLTRFAALNEVAKVKCLLSDKLILPSEPSFEVKPAPSLLMGPTSCIVFGDKHANIWLDIHSNFYVTVYDLPTAAAIYRRDYTAFWDSALPIQFSKNLCK